MAIEGPDERPASTGRQASRSPNPVALAALGLVLCAVAAIGFVRSRESSDAAATADAELDALELGLLQAELVWARNDFINAALFAEVEGRSPAEGYEAYRSRRLELIDDLRRLSEVGDDLGDVALDVLDLQEPHDPGPWPAVAADLGELHYFDVPVDRDGALGERMPALRDAALASVVPHLVLGDVLSIELASRDAGPPDWAAEHVTITAGFALATPGWVGPDRSQPLVDHLAAGPVRDNLSHRSVPAFVSVVDDLQPTLERIWDHDQWLMSRETATTPPPATIAELYADVDEASDRLADGFRASIDAERQRVAADDPGHGAASTWLIASGLALVGGITLLATAAIAQRRRQRHLSRELYVDSLTGAFNRRFLADEAAAWANRDGFHLTVAMIDLDRFKLTNDTWGHAVGDAVLIETTRRLTSATQRAAGTAFGTSTAVVRVGGDEFVVVAATPDPVAVDTFEATLTGVAGPVDVGLPEHVALEFSIGVAAAPTPTSLASLVEAADLALYDHKHIRRSEPRSPSDPVVSQA